MKNESALVIATVARVVRLSTRHAWIVIAAFLVAAVLAGGYVTRHIAINTDSGKLLSSSLPWRQQEIKLNDLFPQRTDQLIAVIDGKTPEAADEAADALVKALIDRKDIIRTITRPDGGEFFARNGILFLSVDDVQRNMNELIKAEPFLGTLALDPTLRGILGAISQSLEGVRLKKTTLEDMRPAVVAIADTLEKVEQGKHPTFSWRRLISGRAPEPSDLRRFVNIQPVLNYSDLAPGGQATKAIRATIAKLGLTPDNGVRVRLTGSVALSDDEFSTIADGAALNGVMTILVVLLILWLALKQARIILAVLINLAVGLSFTAAAGLWMVGALNLISVAFAVLFIGLGVDFGIQFSVRYRAERFADRDLLGALEHTGRGVAGPLLLAAASIAAAFYSFLPTAYVGLSELGLIAGTGMIIAFLTTVTLLPALLAVLKPGGEAAPVGWAWLAPLDHFLDRQRNWVVGLTLAAVVLGLPLLRGLSFDFNPLNLRSKHVESVSTLLDLMRDPDTSPNTIEVLEPNLASASALAEKLSKLPEVAKVRTLESFVPKDQDEKLAIIDDANFFFANTLNPDPIKPAPTPAQTLEAINTTAADLTTTVGDLHTPAADQARRLASALTALSKASPATREEAEPRAGQAAHDDASPGPRYPLGRACDDRHASARAQERLGRARRRGQDRGEAKRGRQRQCGPQSFRRRRAQGRARGQRRAGVHRRGGGDDRQSVSSSRRLVALVDRADPVHRAEALAGRRADADPSARRHHRHARNLRGDRAQAEFRQHHRAAAVARRRRRVQNLLCHGVARRGAQFLAVEPDAGRLFQRLHDRHRLRQPVAFASPGHIEHGQTDGLGAGHDPLRGRPVPAGLVGDAE